MNNHIIPPAVNWHFFPRCNYGCTFCFATFEDIDFSENLEKELGYSLLESLSKEGVEKVTFVGGEPTLSPWLGDYLVKAKELGLVTCIVSNGTGLTDIFLDSWSKYIDWVGMSIDASNDEIHYLMGRGEKRHLKEGYSKHLISGIDAWQRCQSHGIRMKLNTVVCKVNLEDNMLELVHFLRPERWKCFQVLPIDGQNDGNVEDLLITENEYKSWIKKHEIISLEGIQFIPESNDLMRGSYAMIDSLGRFYSNSDGSHCYTKSILDVGIEEAWRQNIFREELFIEREGIYDWEPLERNKTIGECHGK